MTLLSRIIQDASESLFHRASDHEIGKAAEVAADQIMVAFLDGEVEAAEAMRQTLRAGCYRQIRSHLRTQRRPFKGWGGDVVSAPDVVSKRTRKSTGERVFQAALWEEMSRKEHAEYLVDRLRRDQKSAAVSNFHRLVQQEWKNFAKALTAGDVVRLAHLDVPDEAAS